MLKVKDLFGKVNCKRTLDNDIRCRYECFKGSSIMYLDTWRELAECEVKHIEVEDNGDLVIVYGDEA